MFITPKGDNRGLYVTNETSSGFAVRESQGGRSTLAFDYRIVAKPFGSHEARFIDGGAAEITRPRSANLHPGGCTFMV